MSGVSGQVNSLLARARARARGLIHTTIPYTSTKYVSGTQTENGALGTQTG